MNRMNKMILICTAVLAAVFLAAMWMKFIISILFYGASLNRALQVKVSKDCQT